MHQSDHFELENKKNSGEGTQPYLQTPPHWEAGHPSPNLTLGADPGCIE